MQIFKEYIEKQKDSQPYRDFKQYEDEINYFRNYIQPMTNEQANNFRHLGGSARFAQKYNMLPTLYYGLGKEVEDYFIKKKPLADSLGDMKNNLYGAMLGQTMKAEEPETLYQKIYKGYIE